MVSIDAQYKDIWKAAIEKYGAEMQATVCIEELSELQKEICKFIRGKSDVNHLAEEIADVIITVDQMLYLFDCYEQVDEWVECKINRLSATLKTEDLASDQD